MGFLDRLFGNDHQRAADRYQGRESATDRATRIRHQRHHRAARRADRAGQAWENRDRARDQHGDRLTDWNR